MVCYGLVCPISYRWRIIYRWSMGSWCAVQWCCIAESDRKCKFIAIFAVKLNRFFHRGYESHFELVGVISVLSINIHLIDVKVGCSYVCNKCFFKKNKRKYGCFSVVLFRLINYEGKNSRKKFRLILSGVSQSLAHFAKFCTF